MTNKITRIARELYQNSPKSIVAKVRSRLASHRRQPNTLLPDLAKDEALRGIVARCLQKWQYPVTVLGSKTDFDLLQSALPASGSLSARRTSHEWKWGDALPVIDPEDVVLLCPVPVSEEHWNEVHQLKEKFGQRLRHLYESVLPFTVISKAQSILPYFLESLSELTPYYLGDKFFGPIDDLNKLYPLSGKRVIEFGPFDGAQTAGIASLGVASLTCIEIRAENYIKTLLAREVFGWKNVSLTLDDFHNVDAARYGRFDLAFCHGVYYHSTAPFVFLENLISLADNIFVGGFCATDDLPSGSFQELSHKGQSYRVKPYLEVTNFTAGVNPRAYFFEPSDLMKFFTSQGFAVSLISDEPMSSVAGNYLRFLARRHP